MVQFNLLPDVKINLIKARRTNRLVVTIGFLAVVISVLIAGASFSLMTVQKKHITDLDKDIKKYSSDLNGTENLTKILTVQNQLNALPELYATRPAIKRLPSYLDQTTPSVVNLSDIKLDLAEGNIEVTGTSEKLESVNRYVDTLKFTTYTEGDDKDSKVNAFSNVVLSAFAKNDTQTTFTIRFAFDAVIFDESKDVKLLVPSIITTRSQSSSLTNLFSNQSSEKQ